MFRNLRRFVAIEALTLVVGTGTALAAPGDMDPSFGTGGRLEVTGDLVALPDGRIAVAQSNGDGLEVRMLDASGDPDPSWGTGGITRVPLIAEEEGFNTTDMAIGADGSLVLHGGVVRTVASGTKTVPAVLKIDASGHPDASFGPEGNGIVLVDPLPASIGVVTSVAVQADGSILVGATDASYDYCGPSAAVLRLSSAGSPDPGFGTNGWIEIANTDETCFLGIAGARTNGSFIVTNGAGRFWSFNSNGTPDTGFGADGRLSDPLPGLTGYVLLPDGGLLLVGQVNDTSPTRFARFDVAGQPVAAFGNNGILDVDFGGLAFGVGDGGVAPDSLILAPDGQSVFLQVLLYPRTSSATNFCTGVALLRLDGTLDATFGHGGLSCLMGAWPWSFTLAVQANGQPLLTQPGDPTIRLLRANRPSPGLIGLKPDVAYAHENDGTVTVTVSRSAGKDGAVSIDYRTIAHSATADSDFSAASGRLEWADGEDGDRTITLAIHDDQVYETSAAEDFGVELSRAAGDAVLARTTPALVVIQDNDPPPAPAPSSSGGGGATSGPALIALLLLAGIRAATSRAISASHRPLRHRTRSRAVS